MEHRQLVLLQASRHNRAWPALSMCRASQDKQNKPDWQDLCHKHPKLMLGYVANHIDATKLTLIDVVVSYIVNVAVVVYCFHCHLRHISLS